MDLFTQKQMYFNNTDVFLNKQNITYGMNKLFTGKDIIFKEDGGN